MKPLSAVLALLRSWFWQELALTLACNPRLPYWIIPRAQPTPYRHLTDPDGSVYMERYWLFNPYPDERAAEFGTVAPKRYWSFLPSIRLHRILREDRDKHPHDHPWEAARTIILKGAYIEQRLHTADGPVEWYSQHYRFSGDTLLLRHDTFHRITGVFGAGTWTLFITYRKVDTWGFWVDGQKVPYREYLGLPAKESQQ